MQRPRASASAAGLVLAVVAVLVAAAWSVVASATTPTVTQSGSFPVAGGTLTVDAVVSAARARHAMPGMGTDNDPVADGDRRVSLDVTLRADDGSVLEYDAELFTLVVAGESRPVHKAVLPGSAIPGGTQISGTLVFDVPEDATAATLTSDGDAGTTVTLPPETTEQAGASEAADGASEPAHADPHAGHESAPGAVRS